MNHLINATFTDSPKHFWSVGVLTDLVEFIEELKDNDEEEVHERAFEVFNVRINQSINDFLRDIGDLKMIMNCRTKCDDDSHFGGEECARFMSKIVDACSFYLKDSKFLDGNSEGELGYVIRKIREKARKDRNYAIEFERSARRLYLSEGIDKTQEIFKASGYMNENKKFKNVRDFIENKKFIKSL